MLNGIPRGGGRRKGQYVTESTHINFRAAKDGVSVPQFDLVRSNLLHSFQVGGIRDVRTFAPSRPLLRGGSTAWLAWRKR